MEFGFWKVDSTPPSIYPKLVGTTTIPHTHHNEKPPLSASPVILLCGLLKSYHDFRSKPHTQKASIFQLYTQWSNEKAMDAR